MSRAGDLRNITATGTASEDNYVLTYDDTTKKVSLEASAGGGGMSGTQVTITAATAPSTPASGEAFIYASKTSGNTGIRIHASGSSEVLEVRSGSSSTNLMYLNNQGNVQFQGEVSASYFVDRNASSYYLDPGASGTSLNVNGKIFAGGSGVFGSSTAETTISGGTPALQVIGSGFNGYLAAVRRDTTQYASGIALVKSRNTSVGSYTIVQDNDQLGSILFIGDDGTDLDTYGATISARVNGTPGANNMPADIEFATNSGTGSPTLNLKLTKDGVLEGASDAEIKTSPIRIHSNTISTNTTVDTNENAVSGGPVTIATGVTVTVNGDWTVV